MRAMRTIVVSLFLFSCTGSPSPLQPTADEGLVIMKRVNFESPPEDKLQTAQDLLAHAEQYARLITTSSSSETRMEAQRFRRSERATASILMRDAASDYAKQQQMGKARDVYRSMLTTFTGENETSFRQSADAALRGLDEAERVK